MANDHLRESWARINRQGEGKTEKVGTGKVACPLVCPLFTPLAGVPQKLLNDPDVVMACR